MHPSLQRVPLPSLVEQRRIAQVLSTIQRAIENQEVVITAARELKRSLMHRLFTYGPYAEELPTKETQLGVIPSSWNLAHLGDVATHVNSGATPRGGRKVYQKSGIPFIRSQNVLMNRLSMGDVTYISEETHEKMKQDVDQRTSQKWCSPPSTLPS